VHLTLAVAFSSSDLPTVPHVYTPLTVPQRTPGTLTPLSKSPGRQLARATRATPEKSVLFRCKRRIPHTHLRDGQRLGRTPYARRNSALSTDCPRSQAQHA
jgi:hypothetical protein